MTPHDRFPRLVEAAIRIFLSHGFRRAQMDDVARALGVAKGTVYLYVESKEALFDVALRSADRAVAPPLRLPVPTPPAGATLAWVRERLAGEPLLAEVEAVVRSGHLSARDALESILRLVYRTLAANRRGIKLADRCAPDYPELADLWFRGGRGALLALLVRFVESRSRRGQLRRFPDAAVAARIVLETLVFWAVHRHWDPAPQTVDDAAAEETVVRFLVAALVARDVGR